MTTAATPAPTSAEAEAELTAALREFIDTFYRMDAVERGMRFFNPNHDAKGRFATGSGGYTGSAQHASGKSGRIKAPTAKQQAAAQKQLARIDAAKAKAASKAAAAATPEGKAKAELARARKEATAKKAALASAQAALTPHEANEASARQARDTAQRANDTAKERAKADLLETRSRDEYLKDTSTPLAQQFRAAGMTYVQASAALPGAKAARDAAKTTYDAELQRVADAYRAANPGSYVPFYSLGRGDPAFKAASNAYWKTESAYQKAQRAQERAERAYARVKGQLAGKISQSDINNHTLVTRAKVDLAAAQAQYDAMHQLATSARSALSDAQGEHDAAQAGLHAAQLHSKMIARGVTLEPITAGKWGSLDDVPVDVVERIQAMGAQHAPNAVNFHGINKVTGETQLNALQHEVGFDGKPEIRSDAEITMLQKSGEQLAWRGDTNRNGDYTDMFMRGELHTGGGIYGHGTYIAVGTAARGTALNYARGQYNRSLNGKVMRMTIKSGARITEFNALEKQRNADATHWANQLAKETPGTASYRRAAANVWLCSTTGYYAVAHGWDGLSVTTGTRRGKPEGQMTWMNRTALRISDKLY